MLKRIAILSILSRGPCYGPDLRNRLREMGVAMEPTALTKLLGRMEDEDLLYRAKYGHRTENKLAPRGEETVDALREWLRRPSA